MGIFDFLFNKDDEKIKEKDKIEDFFKIDIHELFRYDPVYKKTETSITGNKVDYYEIKLRALELNQFTNIELIEVAENQFNIIFKGINNYITKDMEEFIDLCTKMYGYDRFGNGVVSKFDHNKASQQSFLRWWDNVWIGNMVCDTMELKLYGIKMNKD